MRALARRGGAARAARADAPDRRAPRGAGRRPRRARHARGPREDRTGAAARGGVAARPPAAGVRASGGDRRAPRPGAAARGRGLAADRGALRDPRARRALADGGDHLYARLDDLRAGGARSVYGAAYVDRSSSRRTRCRAATSRCATPAPSRGGPARRSSAPRSRATARAPWPPPAGSRRAARPRSTARSRRGRPGEYPQFFNLVQEGVAWFGDPGQGGPPDAQVQIRVTVLDVPPVGGEDAGPPPPPPDAALPAPDGGVASSPRRGTARRTGCRFSCTVRCADGARAQDSAEPYIDSAIR